MSAMQVLPSLAGQAAVAGTISQLAIVTMDKNGVMLPQGGTVITASVSGGPSFVPAIVTDFSNGNCGRVLPAQCGGYLPGVGPV